MLVAILLFSIFMIGILTFLDFSSRLSQTESALADTQENVRYAAYHVMRTARMMGGGKIPFAHDPGSGTVTWAAGEVLNNQSGTVTGTTVGTINNVMPGSDILIVSGFFEESPYFVAPSNVVISGSNTDIRVFKKFSNPTVASYSTTSNIFQGKGVVLMGKDTYTVGLVNAGSAYGGSDPDDYMDLKVTDPSTYLANMNLAVSPYPPTFPVARVGILDTYAYYVHDNGTLMRIRFPRSPLTDPGEAVAINIGGFQIGVGLDTSSPADGMLDAWQATPTLAAVGAARAVAIRITVLGRTPFDVADWIEPLGTFNVEDMNAALMNRGAKWRRMQVTAALRNFIL